jgi:hypothetical protein
MKISYLKVYLLIIPARIVSPINKVVFIISNYQKYTFFSSNIKNIAFSTAIYTENFSIAKRILNFCEECGIRKFLRLASGFK